MRKYKAKLYNISGQLLKTGFLNYDQIRELELDNNTVLISCKPCLHDDKYSTKTYYNQNTQNTLVIWGIV